MQEMKTLFFGAGPLGSLYAHLFHRSGIDVTILARGERYAWLEENGLAVINEITGQEQSSRVRVVNELKPGDAYDLVIVLIRKNRLPPVFKKLSACHNIENILFMGNNALGFDAYLEKLPSEKILFGFPGAGGGIREQVVHYVDREKPGSKQRAVTIGEIDGKKKARTSEIASLFRSAGIPVVISKDIDGWLKYHVALVAPLCGALYKHSCDNYEAAKDEKLLCELVRAAKEGGRVLKALGYRKRQPFAFNLFYWLPAFVNVMAVKSLLESQFAEIAFSMHASAARDEMLDLANEFQQLAARVSVRTPTIEKLRSYLA